MTEYLSGRIERINELMIESVLDPDIKEAINMLLNLFDEEDDNGKRYAYWLAIRSIGLQIWPNDRVWLKSFKT